MIRLHDSFSTERLKRKIHNIFTVNELINETIEQNQNLRIFSPSLNKNKKPILYGKKRNHNRNSIDHSNIFQKSTSIKSSNSNNLQFLSKTTSTSNLFRNNMVSISILNNQFFDNKTLYTNKFRINSTIESPNTEKKSFIKTITSRLGSFNNLKNDNLKMVKSKSDKIIHKKKNTLNIKDEKMVNSILFDRFKNRNLKNKIANGDSNDDNKNQVIIEPFKNSFGKMLYNALKKSDFIINTINVIYPKVNKSSFFVRDLSNKKKEMLNSHSYISLLPIKNNNNNKIYKVNPIKRTFSLYSKYPINFNRTNYYHSFYKNKSQNIIHNDYNIFKYNDMII